MRPWSCPPLLLACLLALGGGGCAAARAAVLTGPGPWAAVPARASSTGRAPTPAPPTASLSFRDVPAGYWAGPAIAAMSARGVLQGVAPGLFWPDAPVTRAEWAAMLLRLSGRTAGAVGPIFTDVSPGDWYYTSVETVAGFGWMQGVGPGLFSPDAPVTRAQAAITLAAFLGLDQVAADEASLPCLFADCAAIPTWALGAVHVVADLGLLQGAPGGHLQPQTPLSRAAAAEILSRLASLPPATVQAEGEVVARSAHLITSTTELPVGGTVTVRAYAHDATGTIVPAAFHFTVSGPATMTTGPGAAVTLRADGAGTVQLQATTAGGRLQATVTFQVLQGAALRVTGLPPAGLTRTSLPLTVAILDTAGGPDGVFTGMVHLAAVPVGQVRPAATTQALASAGEAHLELSPLRPGHYTLTFTAPGLPARKQAYRVVGAPLGAVRLLGGASLATWRSGQQATLQAELPGRWPVQVTAAGGAVRITGSAAVLAGRGPVATLEAADPGSATITVSVPGGALRPSTIRVGVAPRGTFRTAGTVQHTVAGQPVSLRIGLDGTPGEVTVRPVDPAGHPLPLLPATVQGTAATARFVPDTAGRWSLVWNAPGFPALQTALQVDPGPATQLVVDPTPTSILLPGQSAVLRAWLADAHGNPVPGAFSLRLAGGCSRGVLRTDLSQAGPGAFGSFLARTPGNCTLVFSSPDHPGTGGASVTFRVVATPAGMLAGKGLWLTYPDWADHPDAQLLAAAAADGATHIYLEVATSSDGFYGGPALDDLLRQAHADGLAVISWVYAALDHPQADAAIARRVATYTSPYGDLADGLALDIEDQLQPSAVAAYARAAATALGPAAPLVGITWPPQQRPDYPYRALAPFVTAFAPMDYWHVLPQGYSYAQVYGWVLQSVQALRRDAGRPTVPVDVALETFDWFASASGQGRFSPSAAELTAAIRAASDAGAIGVSFYRLTTATAAETAVIRASPWPPG